MSPHFLRLASEVVNRIVRASPVDLVNVPTYSLRWVMFVFIPLGLVHRPRVCPSVLNTIFFTILRGDPILAPEMIPLAAIVHEPFPRLRSHKNIAHEKNPRWRKFEPVDSFKLFSEISFGSFPVNHLDFPKFEVFFRLSELLAVPRRALNKGFIS